MSANPYRSRANWLPVEWAEYFSGRSNEQLRAAIANYLDWARRNSFADDDFRPLGMVLS